MKAAEFARKQSVTYATVLSWLKQGLIPSAVEKPGVNGKVWYIPRSALQMEKPQRGAKKGRARVR
jgi:hypothetical protein